MKKGKSNALLVELLIVTLFFALSAAVLVEVFAAAGKQGGSAKRLDQAQALAQDAAEQIYAVRDVPQLLEQSGYVSQDDVYVREEDGLRLTVALTEEPADAGTLLRAQVCVNEGEETLITLPVARYVPGEVAE